MKNFIAALLLLFVALPVRAEIAGKPTVISGDIIIVGGVRLHLYGIDAPEPNQVCNADGEPYRCGTVAMTALMDLVAGQSVRCRLKIKDGAPYTFAFCEAGGFDLSSNMVHTGWALADRLTTDKYVSVESKAREAGRGLWRGEFAPPWEWRKR